eukprot:278773-Chlamydomonas_euryale.AAC.1
MYEQRGMPCHPLPPTSACSNPLLHVAKIVHISEVPVLKDLMLPLFAVVFFVVRVAASPYAIVYPGLRDAPSVLSPLWAAVLIALMFFVCGLQVWMPCAGVHIVRGAALGCVRSLVDEVVASCTAVRGTTARSAVQKAARSVCAVRGMGGGQIDVRARTAHTARICALSISRFGHLASWASWSVSAPDHAGGPEQGAIVGADMRCQPLATASRGLPADRFAYLVCRLNEVVTWCKVPSMARKSSRHQSEAKVIGNTDMSDMRYPGWDVARLEVLKHMCRCPASRTP